jgi:hypothetical protein
MAREIAARYILPTPKPEATEGGAHEKGLEAAAQAICKYYFGWSDDNWLSYGGVCRGMARAALTAKPTDGREGEC